MMMAIMFLPNYDTLKRAVWYFEEGVDTLKRVVWNFEEGDVVL